MKQIEAFIQNFNKASKSSDINLFFVRLEGLGILTLAYGHLEAEKQAQKLADNIGGARVMCDQIFIIEAGATKAKSKKTLEHLRKSLYEFEPHIAYTITHKLFKKGTSAEVAMFEIAALQTDDYVALSKSAHDDTAKKIAEAQKLIWQASEIKKAIAKKNFHLAFQPIVESKTGKISHHEALLRIEDKGGLKSAGSLIPAAETLGLIDEIDVYVLESVIDILKTEPKRKIALNLSNQTISNREWLKSFFSRMTPEIGKRLIIEITETSAHKNLKETAYFIATLQDAGCQFALDDFGSGYTSFRQIRALSFDYVKIDGSLISDIAVNKHHRVLVKAILEYLHSVKVKTIAEFVETGEIAKILMDFGIDYMQGNYFGAAT